MNKVKFLVVGDVEGRWTVLEKYISQLQRKVGEKKFVAVFCVGNAFGKDAGNLPTLELPSFTTPVYFVLGPEDPDYSLSSNGQEVRKNFFYLGRFGVKDLFGLRVAYLSGGFDPLKFREPKQHDRDVKYYRNYIHKDLKKTKFSNVDLLLTCEWPKGFHNLSTTLSMLPANPWNVGSVIVAKLNMKSCPRYHFCGLEDKFYQLYPHKAGEGSTRLIGLGKFQSKAGQRGIHALALEPKRCMSEEGLAKLRDEEASEIPYKAELKLASDFKEKALRKLSKRKITQATMDQIEREDKLMSNMRWAEPSAKKQRRERDPRKAQCIFCLDAQQDQHLIVSIGDESYLTYSKGGITNEHTMLIPINHYEGQLVFPEVLREETKRYVDAMADFCNSTGKELLCWERCIPSRINHSFFELLPIPGGTDWISALNSKGKENGLKFETVDVKNVNSLDSVTERKPYMVMWSGDEGYCAKVEGKVQGWMFRFLRTVAAAAIGLPNRADWRECEQNKSEETKVVGELQKKFAKFDFTMLEDLET